MGTLTIEFRGLAIHMTQFSPYRVIIPGGPIPTGFTLSPTASEILGRLDGVTFTVGGGQPLSVQIDPLPHLCALYPAINVNPDVTTNRQPPAVAYFDLKGGTVSMIRTLHARYAKVRLEVDGDHAFIQVQRWNEPLIKAIQVRLPKTIVIKNVPTPNVTQFEAPEYMGNFLIASNFPTGTVLAAVEKAIKAALDASGSGRHPADTFPSCSNSQWP
jgi:hypothetical protein